MKKVIVLAVVLAATVATGQRVDTMTRLPYELHWSDNAEFGAFRLQRFTPPRIWVDSIYLPDTVDTMTTVIPQAVVWLDSVGDSCPWTWFTVLDPGQRSVYGASLEMMPHGGPTRVAFPGVRFTTLGTHVARCSAYCYGLIPDTAAVREFEVVPYRVGVEEPGWPSARCTWSGATMVRGVLRVREASGVGRRASGVLLDIAGRRVMGLKPGENDVSRLSPGVYFVRVASGVERRASSVHKVVIQK